MGLRALALCSILIFPACAHGHVLSARPAGAGGIQAEPAEITTASFFVRNEGDRVLDVVERLDLPVGWTPVSSRSIFRLDPGEEILRLVGFHVPLASTAGQYSILYEADTGHDVARATARRSVVVLPTAGLSVADLGVPDRVLAGDVLRAPYEVVNHGNVPATVLVHARSSESYPVDPETMRFTVAAGESRGIEIEVGMPAEADGTTEHVLKVEAATVGPNGDRVSAESVTFQTMIALAPAAFDPYHRVPSRLRIGYAGGRGGTGMQVEYSGHGQLTDDGASRVDFLLRAPNVQDESVFGLRDEYRVEFLGESYRWQAGDAPYDLSVLTVRQRFGRGAGGRLELGRWTLGGWRSKSVWVEPRFDDTAAFARYRHSDRAEFGVNYLRKHAGLPGDVASLTARTRLLSRVEVDLEYARNLEGRGGSHRAYVARLRGSRGDIRYFVERLRGGKDFVGSHRHEVQTVGSVSLPVLLDVRLDGIYRDYEQGLDELADYISKCHEHASSVGLRRDLPLGLRAAADWRNVDRRGQTGCTPYDYTTRTIRLSLEKPHTRVSAWGFLETGVLENRLERAEYRATRYGFRVSCRVGPRCRASGHFHSALPGSGDPTMRNDVAGVHVALTPFAAFELDAGFQWKGYSEEEHTDVEEFTAGGRYTLPSGHDVSGRLRWTRSTNDDAGETVFGASYSIPVGLRASRKTTSGSLAGTIFDAEAPGWPGIEGVVVLLDGMAAITDSDGRFSFPGIEPGTYFLSVDRSSVGLRRVSTYALPLAVNVTGGRERRIDLGVATPGSVSGQVMLDESSMVTAMGVGMWESRSPLRLPVTLVGDGETLRTTTDADGEFSFADVRPGRWVLTIDSRELPPLSELEQESYLVEVMPGAVTHLRARVLPVQREIPILETGEFRISERGP